MAERGESVNGSRGLSQNKGKHPKKAGSQGLGVAVGNSGRRMLELFALNTCLTYRFGATYFTSPCLSFLI